MVVLVKCDNCGKGADMSLTVEGDEYDLAAISVNVYDRPTRVRLDLCVKCFDGLFAEKIRDVREKK